MERTNRSKRMQKGESSLAVRAAIIAGHATVGWAFCAAIIGVGRQMMSMEQTLIAHAVGAPIGFAFLSWFYFRKFGFTSPLQTALLFLLIVMALDVFVVASLIERSYAMFRSPLGTWIPLALIFVATYVTGLATTRSEAGGR